MERRLHKNQELLGRSRALTNIAGLYLAKLQVDATQLGKPNP
jgi:hypothetical protein